MLNLLVAILYELFLEESEGTAVRRASPRDWLIVRKVRGGAGLVDRFGQREGEGGQWVEVVRRLINCS